MGPSDTPVAEAPDVHVAAAVDLDVRTVYAVLRLRSEVFVVEQDCVYADLDGRDLEPGARWCWATRAGTVVATLRTLQDGDGATPRLRIGRVATAREARSGGIAATLVRHAVATAGGRDVVLDAQAHLVGWYERLGFVRDGADFVEDGIPHVPMRLAGPPNQGPDEQAV